MTDRYEALRATAEFDAGWATVDPSDVGALLAERDALAAALADVFGEFADWPGGDTDCDVDHDDGWCDTHFRTADPKTAERCQVGAARALLAAVGATGDEPTDGAGASHD